MTRLGGSQAYGMRVLVVFLSAALCLWNSAEAFSTRPDAAFLFAKPGMLPVLRGGGAKTAPLLNSIGNVWNSAKHRVQNVVGAFGLRMSPRDKDYETKVLQSHFSTCAVMP